MSAPRWCPICGEPVAYVTTPRGSWWVHTATGHFFSTEPERHDVNTYSPNRLLTEAPTS